MCWCQAWFLEYRTVLHRINEESLRVLQLGFESCPLGLLGARAIAEALPQDLDALHLESSAHQLVTNLSTFLRMWK